MCNLNLGYLAESFNLQIPQNIYYIINELFIILVVKHYLSFGLCIDYISLKNWLYSR
jgi:hypothetical protein